MEFNGYDFVYAVCSFFTGIIAVLAAFLALLSLFPIGQFKENYVEINRKINELSKTVFPKITSYEEWLHVRGKTVELLKNYQNVYERQKLLEAKYYHLLELNKWIGQGIRFLSVVIIVLLTGGFFVSLLPLNQLIFILLLLVCRPLLVYLFIKYNEYYQYMMHIILSTEVQDRYMHFGDVSQLLDLKNKDVVDGDKFSNLEDLSMFVFARISYVTIIKRYENGTTYMLGESDKLKSQNYDTYIRFSYPNFIKIDTNAKITVDDVEGNQRYCTIAKKDFENLFYRGEDTEIIFCTHFLFDNIKCVHIEFESNNSEFRYDRNYIESDNAFFTARIFTKSYTEWKPLKFNFFELEK